MGINDLTRAPTVDLTRVQCLDCGWQGLGCELRAQACPVCDGRVAEKREPAEPAPEALMCECCGEPAGAGGALCPACAATR